MKEAFLAVLASIDANTTRLGEYIAGLLAKLAAGGMSKDEEAAVLAEAQAAVARLANVGVVTEGAVDTGGETSETLPTE